MTTLAVGQLLLRCDTSFPASTHCRATVVTTFSIRGQNLLSAFEESLLATGEMRCHVHAHELVSTQPVRMRSRVRLQRGRKPVGRAGNRNSQFEWQRASVEQLHVG